MAAPADGASTRRDGCARLGTAGAGSSRAARERHHRRGIGNLVAETSSSSSADAATSPLTHLVAGSIAGGLSRTVAAPLETVRVRLMTGATATGGSPSILAMLADISRREGVRALWKGNAAVVARFAPTKGLDFFTFNLYKRALSAVGVGPVRAGDENGGIDRRGGHPSTSRPSRGGVSVSAQRAVAGGLAGATSTALLYPLDNIATRLATSAATGAAMVNGVKVVGALGLLRAIGRVASTEGVRGLYRGFGPAVLGIVPEAAITYGAYDALKEWAAGKGGEGECGVLEATACGIVAALAGTAATFPASVVSRRMITGTVPGLDPSVGSSVGGSVGGKRARAASMGLFKAMAAVAEAEGVMGLYRGLGTASVRLVPMAIVSFASYEWVKRTMDAADARARTKGVGIEVDVA